MVKKKTTEEKLKDIEEKRQQLLIQLDKEKSKGMRYVIARTYSAGVFAGYLFIENGKECILKDARRLWYWKGSASLSQMAVNGTSKPEDCKFPISVPEVTLKEVIEIIPCTKEGQESIKSVKIWVE